MQTRRLGCIAALVGGASRGLEGQLECQLQQARAIAQTCDGAEGSLVGEVERSGLSELRMIEGVEGFGSELYPHHFLHVEALEDRGVEVVESRTASLLRRSTEDGGVGLSDRHSFSRVDERVGVQPLRAVVRSGIDVRARNDVGFASKASCCGDGAADREGLSALVAVDEVRRPATDDGIDETVGIGQIRALMADGEGIGSGDVNDMRGIDVAQAIVSSDAEAGKPLRPVVRGSLGLRLLIAQALREGVVRQHGKAMRDLVLVGELTRLVVADAVGGLVRRSWIEALEGNVVEDVLADRHDLRNRVVSGEVVEVPAQRADVCNLDRVVVGELILNCKVHRLDVGRLEVALTAVEIQPLATVDRVHCGVQVVAFDVCG